MAPREVWLVTTSAIVLLICLAAGISLVGSALYTAVVMYLRLVRIILLG